MSDKNLKEQAVASGVRHVMNRLLENPDENLKKMSDWVIKWDKDGKMRKYKAEMDDVFSNPNNNWYRFIHMVLEDIDPAVLDTLIENMLINSAVTGLSRQRKAQKKHECNIPWAILLDPTSACNLHCTGCWAAEYGQQMNLTYETMSGIVAQGKPLGTYFYVLSGGEPLVRKKDVIRLCEEHNDCMFLAFTNGTLIDEEFADEMLRVKNFVPAISIEGFEADTDDRRGSGTYGKVIDAMRILKERKLVFGASCCYTSKNTEIIGSDNFMDDLVVRGAKFAWFFTYMPVGVGAPTDLMASAAQRAYMFERIREMRSTKPIFTMDFWNDGDTAGGCIAGGRSYLHINANGDIEPCAFIHYSDSNIYEKTLLEAYQSPLFMQYHNNQPFSDNLYRPCPLLDNQGKLAEMVHASGAHSTDMSAPEDVDVLCAKCRQAADAWQPVADTLWEERQRNVERKASNG